MTLSVCLSVSACREGSLHRRCPHFSFLRSESDQGQEDSVLGGRPSASSFTAVTEVQPAARAGSSEASDPGQDSSLLSPSCLFLVSKFKVPFSPSSSPIHPSCFCNACPGHPSFFPPISRGALGGVDWARAS